MKDSRRRFCRLRWTILSLVLLVMGEVSSVNLRRERETKSSLKKMSTEDVVSLRRRLEDQTRRLVERRKKELLNGNLLKDMNFKSLRQETSSKSDDASMPPSATEVKDEKTTDHSEGKETKSSEDAVPAISPTPEVAETSEPRFIETKERESVKAGGDAWWLNAPPWWLPPPPEWGAPSASMYGEFYNPTGNRIAMPPSAPTYQPYPAHQRMVFPQTMGSYYS